MNAVNAKRRRVWLQMGLILIGSAAASGPALAKAPALGANLYVLLEGENEVEVLSTTESNGFPYKKVTTIPVGEIASVVRATPNNSQVWVPNGGSGNITVISTPNNSTQTYSTAWNGEGVCYANGFTSPCTFPGSVVFNAAGTYAFLVDSGDNTLKIINTSTYAVVAAVTTTTASGDFPSSVALSLDGNTAYVPNLVSNTVAVLDVSNPAYPSLTTTIQLPAGTSSGATCENYTEGHGKNKKTYSSVSGPSPSGARVDPTGAYLYVTNAYDDALVPATPPCQESTVTVITTSNNQVVATIPTGGYVATDVNFLPSGYALVANTGTDAVPDNVIGVLNAYYQTLATSFTLPTGVGPAEVDPTGQLVYVPTIGDPPNGGASVTILSASSPTTVLDTYTLPKRSFPASIAIIPTP
jgi:DNA-binding beta-propeller fold protein YncE